MRKKLSKKQFVKTVELLVNRHGKVRILLQDKNDPTPCNCVCKNCETFFLENSDQRRRTITKNGRCNVEYRSDGYSKFGGLEESCFMEEYSIEYGYDYTISHGYNLKSTLKFMMQHDYDCDLIPTLIEYGKQYKKKIKLY